MFTVWVGGVDVAENVGAGEALSVAQFYREDGFDDVVIETLDRLEQ